MDRFDYIIIHVPGKFLYTADTLSGAPINDEENESHIQKLTEVYIYMQDIVISSLPASPERLDIYCQGQKKDLEHSSIIYYCKAGWPLYPIAVQLKLGPFWKARHYLTVCDNLLLYRSMIVVPQSLRKETMEKIHYGHQGEECCC